MKEQTSLNLIQTPHLKTQTVCRKTGVLSFVTSLSTLSFLPFTKVKQDISKNTEKLRSTYLVWPLTSVDPFVSNQLAWFLEALVTCITFMDKSASIYVAFMTLV
jgi:hypothetical protein